MSRQLHGAIDIHNSIMELGELMFVFLVMQVPWLWTVSEEPAKTINHLSARGTVCSTFRHTLKSLFVGFYLSKVSVEYVLYASRLKRYQQSKLRPDTFITHDGKITCWLIHTLFIPVRVSGPYPTLMNSLISHLSQNQSGFNDISLNSTFMMNILKFSNRALSQQFVTQGK